MHLALCAVCGNGEQRGGVAGKIRAFAAYSGVKQLKLAAVCIGKHKGAYAAGAGAYNGGKAFAVRAYAP